MICDRVAVVETIYHQKKREQPTSIGSAFSRDLKTDELPYETFQNLTEDWSPLDVGWVETCGMLVIKNLEGIFTQTIPTEEEKTIADAKIVDVWFGGPIAEIEVPPTESSRFRATVPIQVRCRSGGAKILVFAVPK
jgi:hypothetical protein